MTSRGSDILDNSKTIASTVPPNLIGDRDLTVFISKHKEDV